MQRHACNAAVLDRACPHREKKRWREGDKERNRNEVPRANILFAEEFFHRGQIFRGFRDKLASHERGSPCRRIRHEIRNRSIFNDYERSFKLLFASKLTNLYVTNWLMLIISLPIIRFVIHARARVRSCEQSATRRKERKRKKETVIVVVVGAVGAPCFLSTVIIIQRKKMGLLPFPPPTTAAFPPPAAFSGDPPRRLRFKRVLIESYARSAFSERIILHVAITLARVHWTTCSSARRESRCAVVLESLSSTTVSRKTHFSPPRPVDASV